MSNTFAIPKKIVAGDAVTWYDSELSGVDSATGKRVVFSPDLFQLSWAFRGSTAVDVVAVADGTRYKSTLPETEIIPAGMLHWQAYITELSTNDRSTIGLGSLLVNVNLALSTTYDNRSSSQQLLDRVNAAIIALTNGKPLESYSINGRDLKYMSLEDLTNLRQQLRKEVAAEELAKSQSKGRKRRYVRFNQPEFRERSRRGDLP
jgi:hypothetical protein